MKHENQEGVADQAEGRRLPVVRSAIAGVLMGLANLVPGVSGGTMVLVMGLYDEFIAAVADTTRLKFKRRNLLLLLIIGGAAVLAIAGLAGTIRELVTSHRSATRSLFIGLTLGGVPLLLRLIRAFSAPTVIGTLCGLALMIVIDATSPDKPDKAARREAVADGEFVIQPDYPRDVVAGVLGMSAMVMPGVSGAYMLLILDRYEPILASIDVCKTFVTSGGETGDLGLALRVIIPVAVGSILGLLFLSNLLKWLLRHHEKPTLGFLLGILLGSPIGIWPFDANSASADYLIGFVLVVVGLAATWLLSKVGAEPSATD